MIVVSDIAPRVTVTEDNASATITAPGPQGIPGPAAVPALFGSFYSTARQQLAANTATAMTLTDADIFDGVTIVDGSEITVTTAGVYDLQFSAQVHHLGGGGNGRDMHVWFRVNGDDVAWSTTRVVIEKNDYEVIAWDYLFNLDVGDNVQLVWQVNNADIILEQQAASGSVPAIPSLIVTVMQVR